MSINVAINGFGRIGRPSFKIAMENPDINIVAINDLTDINVLAHLLKYDSNYGTYQKNVEVKEGALVVDGKEIKVFSEPNPANLPWKEHEVDVVLECTGVFRTKEKASGHIEAGAKLVIISAPAKGGDVTTCVRGVNDEEYSPVEGDVIDNASCTTNSIAPVVEILERHFGIEKAFLTTIHSYTADQNLVDAPHSDLRRARGAAANIVPTSTGAATATCSVVDGIDSSSFDGLAFRVPTPVVSVSDITALLSKDVSIEEINSALEEESKSERYSGILGFSMEELVSSDVRMSPLSGLVDGKLTNVTGGNLAKVVIWYDNEWGYSNRLVEQAIEYGKKFS